MQNKLRKRRNFPENVEKQPFIYCLISPTVVPPCPLSHTLFPKARVHKSKREREISEKFKCGKLSDCVVPFLPSIVLLFTQAIRRKIISLHLSFPRRHSVSHLIIILAAVTFCYKAAAAARSFRQKKGELPSKPPFFFPGPCRLGHHLGRRLTYYYTI